MPYYEKSEDWLHQSALLLQARPQTTRVTTSYSLRPAIRPSKAEKLAAKEARRAKEKKETSSKKTPAASTEEQTPKDAATASAKPPRGQLVLKTFDPHSGVCLKYKTSKAAEVGRLIQMLGQLGRRMAALPVDEAKESADVVMADAAAAAAVAEEGAAAAAAAVSGTATPVAGASTPAPAAGGGGQGKKKKKGKR
ncbi:signal recognition particle 9 kDa protein domain-containing protein [Neurospora intermedia]|uniref:Signal recognition particle 9 kDa protein domain-containing protein n=1 Tax=Neurospora intermedia TaxID=5142 RepID=A0ABR3DPY2_NEUIN